MSLTPSGPSTVLMFHVNATRSRQKLVARKSSDAAWLSPEASASSKLESHWSTWVAGSTTVPVMVSSSPVDEPQLLRAARVVDLRHANARPCPARRAARPGRRVLRARAPGRRAARATLINHPNGGPVLSRPQVQPWQCQPGAKDAQCNQPPAYAYSYKSSVTGQFAAYDPANPPPDVATTTTQTGEQVPFIVRTETGYQNRDQYKIAVLFRPGTRWKAWAPQRQFNHKLLITHGASCGIEHQAGDAPSVTDGNAGTALGMGFAVMSTALDNAGHNCNIATQAESLIMAKERLVERYGTLRYAIGTGCSGGSLPQQQVSNASPGIYQGILPQCSFPDSWSPGQQLAAYNLIRRYVEDPSRWAPGVTWDPVSIGAVEGHPNH